jgi:hypothetical protein
MRWIVITAGGVEQRRAGGDRGELLSGYSAVVFRD